MISDERGDLAGYYVMALEEARIFLSYDLLVPIYAARGLVGRGYDAGAIGLGLLEQVRAIWELYCTVVFSDDGAASGQGIFWLATQMARDGRLFVEIDLHPWSTLAQPRGDVRVRLLALSDWSRHIIPSLGDEAVALLGAKWASRQIRSIRE